MFKTIKVYNYFLSVSLSVLFMSMAVLPDKVYAQKCGEVLTDEDIAKYFAESTCSKRVIYGIPAIVGKRAIPGLKNWADETCRYSALRTDVYIALARLGDENALKELEKRLYANKLNSEEIENLAFVRNDKALSVLMTYLSKYRTDRSLWYNMKVDGGGDVMYEPLASLGIAIWEITFLWNFPAIDLPDKPSLFMDNRDEWEEWWSKQKDIPFNLPDYSNVSDPQLRCLARMAEWGLPEAIMSMTELPGKEKEIKSILKSFHRVKLKPFGVISGTIDAALFRLGDAAIQEELVKYLSVKESPARNRALKKIRIANTKAGIDALLTALEAEIAQVPEAELNKFRGRILNSLAEMVENPPLGDGAAPTPENFQMWKQWWLKNKNTAVLKKEPFIWKWSHYMGDGNWRETSQME